MQRKYTVEFHIPGVLSADLDIRWNPPDNCQLVHVSGCTSGAADETTITIGDETTAALHLASFAVGVGANTVHEKPAVAGAFSEFATGQWPRILDGDTVVIAVDYDGDSGDAGNDLTLALTFLEG